MKNLIYFIFITFSLIISPMSVMADEKSDNEAMMHDGDEVRNLTTTCQNSSKDPAVVSKCVLNGLKDLAGKGNFVAEHALGLSYLKLGDKAEATKWFQASLKNPRNPQPYKDEVEKDVKKMDQGVQEGQEAKPATESKDPEESGD